MFSFVLAPFKYPGIFFNFPEIQLPCKTKENCILFCSELYIFIQSYQDTFILLSFDIRQKILFLLQYMSFDRSHRLYFLHKYQYMSTISKFQLLETNGGPEGQFLMYMIPKSLVFPPAF